MNVGDVELRRFLVFDKKKCHLGINLGELSKGRVANETDFVSILGLKRTILGDI